MPSLMDKAHGYAAMAVRRTLGKDDRSRIRELEREVDELKRILSRDVRLYQGMTINDHSTVIDLDHKRRHFWQCDDGTLTFEKIMGKTYGVNACVDVQAVVDIIVGDPGMIGAICDACPGGTPGMPL